MEQIAANNPICPSCYESASKIPIDGLSYYQCKTCRHAFANLSNPTKNRIIKRSIINGLDKKSGLFKPFSLFGGSKNLIEKCIMQMSGKKKVVVSNFDFHTKNKNIILNKFDINPEDSVFDRILESHTEIKGDSLLSTCFMPFYDDIHHFILSCYKMISKNRELIILANSEKPFMQNNIGQIHHFTGESLHHIMSFHQGDYNIFISNGILGLKLMS